MGKNIFIELDPKRVRPKSSEVDRLVCDNTKLMNHSLWKPTYTLKSGLKETIEWFMANISLYKSDIYNI